MINRMNFRRAILNWGMLLSVMLSLLYYGFGLRTNGLLDPRMDMDILSALPVPFALTGYIWFAPVFPAIPYAHSYLTESQSGYLSYIIPRTGRKRYIASKLLWTGLSGGIASALPVAVMFLWFIIILSPSSPNPASEYYPYMYEGMIWEPYVGVWGGGLVLLLKLLIIFLFGVFWAEATLLLSLLIRNKYLVLVIPITLYLLLWMIGIPKPLYGLMWMALYRSDFDISMPIWGPFAVQGVNILAVCLLMIWLFRRRLWDE